MNNAAENLFYGECLLVVSPHREITLVLGLEGAGKSTLINFISGRPRRLESKWNENKYTFETIDHDSVNSSLHKKFVPQLAIHNETKSAIYEIPGFADNDPISVEIAKAYFTNVVTSLATSVKVVIVARDTTLDNRDRFSFPRLLQYLSKLMPNPAIFSGGMTLIATKAPDTPYEILIVRYLQYFNYLLEILNSYFRMK